ncbi:hypothetical protein [Curtobacterium sp. MCSS17_016]|uniref:hypothetical protein n=1 Tax=Curtobacterium sp. MCSS17_016 TaxID=2175644 RepID=UPI000DA8A8C1|nr:hypothetical protein [Curtobacterium sp. MCSS17_016]WIE80968.1 hypothetical protein DEJ19_020845 [Curtobacterium sp. MCSS17_016]
MPKHYPENIDLKLGARVKDSAGTVYTRFAARGQADWITADGVQHQHLPVKDFEVEYNPKKDDVAAAFSVTPAFRGKDGVGFGVVRDTDITPGDIIFYDGFKLILTNEVLSVHQQVVAGEDRVQIRGRGDFFHVVERLVYVARRTGPIKQYTA